MVFAKSINLLRIFKWQDLERPRSGLIHRLLPRQACLVRHRRRPLDLVPAPDLVLQQPLALVVHRARVLDLHLRSVPRQPAPLVRHQLLVLLPPPRPLDLVQFRHSAVPLLPQLVSLVLGQRRHQR